MTVELDVAATENVDGKAGFTVPFIGVPVRADFLAALAALLGVLVFDTLPGLFIGIAVSLILLLYRASRPHIARLARGTEPGVWLDTDRHPDLTPEPTVLVLRAESGLFFANADHIRATVRALVTEETRAVVLDAQTAPFIDVTATDMLTQLAGDLARRSVTLAIAHPIGQTRDVLQRAAQTAGTALALYPDVDTAVAATPGHPAGTGDDHRPVTTGEPEPKRLRQQDGREGRREETAR